MVGTDLHWWAFYDYAHPCLADLIIDRKFDKIVEYYDVSGKSPLLSDGWHAEDWFHNLGGKQRYMIFDASPIYDSGGKLIAAIETLEDITERKRIEEENIKLATELQKASDGVKLLSGLLPTCAACKKIRDNKGYWNQIETYIQDHSEAKFSHGICPECARKLYPDLNVKI